MNGIITNEKRRDDYWDIVKGIGIISVVIGHTYPLVSPFVYMYHLICFFFVGAYFYKRDLYKNNPFGNIAHVLKGNYTRYILYTLVLILLHNSSVRFSLYYGIGYYTKVQALVAFCNTFAFASPELFGGALWFVPVYIFTLSLFGIVICFANCINGRIVRYKAVTKNYIEHVIVWLMTMLIAFVGVYFCINKIELLYHIHIGMVVFPMCTVAYYIRWSGFDLKKYCKWWVGLLAAGLLYVFVYRLGYRIELTNEEIINGYMFYVASLIGVVYVLSLANIIQKLRILNWLFALFGKYSFAIMALHFFVVKCIDRVYAYCIGEQDKEVIGRWTCTYPDELWIVYAVIGCLAPSIVCYILDKVVRSIKAKFHNC